jgi:hypothetical protein
MKRTCAVLNLIALTNWGDVCHDHAIDAMAHSTEDMDGFVCRNHRSKISPSFNSLILLHITTQQHGPV